MPISSGFSADRPSAMHRTQLTRPIRRPQIIARARQFQEDLRTKQRHVPFGKGAAGRPSVPERPTAAVKQPSRSNTFTLPKKIEQQSNVKTTKELPKLKGRAPSPAFLPPPPPPPPARAPRKELINYPSAAPVRPTLKAIPSMNDQRRPVRFASEVNYAYPSASSAWTNTHHHHLPPPPPPVANRTTRTIHDNNYPNSQHRTTFTDYPSNTVSDYHHSWTSLPPITSQPHFSTIPSGPPTVVIRSKETYPSNPSYHSSAPFMYVPSPPMFVPYSYPYAPPAPPPPPPLPVPVPLPSTSIVNQASSSATTKVDSQPPTIIVPPVQEKQNVTIRLQMADEVPQPVVHVVRRPAPRNYVYVDENDDDRVIVDPPATQIIRRRRRRQPEVIYIDEDDDYVDDDVIYVDENGRQVEYIYDEPVRYRTYPKIRQTNATNVVYQ